MYDSLWLAILAFESVLVCLSAAFVYKDLLAYIRSAFILCNFQVVLMTNVAEP